MCENNTFLQNNVSKFSKSMQQTCKLSSIAKVERGKFSIRPRNNPAYYGGYMPFVQTGDISASNKLLMKYSQTLNDKGVSVSKIFPAGTILITIAANIGDVAITTFSVACPDSVVGIAAKKCNMHWLYYVLNSKKHILNALATQNAQKNINLEILNSLKIKTSPLPEQEKIAEILSCWDDAIEQLTDLIAEKKQQKKAIMQRLVTGKQRLPGFAEPWGKEKLSKLCDIETGKKDVNEGNPTGKYPFFTCAKTHTFADTFSYDKEAILIAGNGDVGNCQYYNGKFEAYQRTYILHNFRTNVKLLFQILDAKMSKYASGQKQQGAMPYIKLGTLADFLIDLPSNPAEQTAIADILMTADAEIDLLKRQLDAITEQKRGLMQKLLTGQIRVKVDKK